MEKQQVIYAVTHEGGCCKSGIYSYWTTFQKAIDEAKRLIKKFSTEDESPTDYAILKGAYDYQVRTILLDRENNELYYDF